MIIYVYILFSRSLQKYYAGISDDVQKRLREHNAGKGKFTSKGIPWDLITTIKCLSRSEAMLLEKKIKKRGIKRYLEDNIE
ncbi:MAG: GIY-YIG nuclease family protein [Chitinophagales bacterium]|nr:GIY-YIG nuclease family protein [Chitinophagales bacterium]